MKIAWLCSYNLIHLADKINLDKESYNYHSSTWIYYLSEEFAQMKDIELNVLTLSFHHDHDLFTTYNGINFFIFGAKPKRSTNRFYNYLLKYRRLRTEQQVRNLIIRKLKEINPDIINVHGTELFCSINGYAEKINRLQIPVVLWMQGVLNIVFKNSDNSFTNVLKTNEARFFKEIKYFITKKGNMEEEIGRFNNFPVFYNLFYPVSNNCFQLYTENFEPEFDLVFTGSLVQRKGIEDFIKLVGIILLNNPGIRSVAIGRAENKLYQDFLAQMVKQMNLEKNLYFAGTIENHDDVLLMIKKAKVLVLPTYADSAPVVVAEAMSMGVPVIAYDVDGLPGMVQNGVSGILVEKGNIQALAESAIELLADPQKRKKLADQAYLFAKKEYDCQVVAQKTVQVYNEIIQNEKGIK